MGRPGQHLSTRSRRVVGGLLAVALLGCSSGDRGGSVGDGASAPFTVGPVPERYRPITAGFGTTQPGWGDDSFGTEEPYTVLSPDGTASGPDVVIVSITGFEGYQGGLSQAARGAYEVEEAFTVDGRDAIYHPAARDARGDHWADLVAVRGDDLAVRATSLEATREELVAVVRSVEQPTDHRRAPMIADPPAHLGVVGSVDVEAVLALDPFVAERPDQVPGGPASHVAGWIAGPVGGREQLVVMTVPRSAVDLRALGPSDRLIGHLETTWREREVEGRPAMVSSGSYRNDPSRRRRSVWLESEWDDIVVVTASGASVPTEAELTALAASVERTNDAAWDELVIEATGGPGLHADADRVELARGQVDDLEWLLQTAPYHDVEVLPAEEPAAAQGVDECLILSDRTRICAQIETRAGHDWVAYSNDEEQGLSFVIVSTTLSGASIRVTSRSDQVTAPLHRVPGEDAWGAAVFIDDPGPADGACRTGDHGTAPRPGAYADMRVEALDAHGEVIGCLGVGPGSHVGGI